ncbi:MAG TPA: hypothetical protein EYP10_13710 [Armatimonadetes bacterium]|nr:hypothetical protein [Armatimonadota bacterium]
MSVNDIGKGRNRKSVSNGIAKLNDWHFDEPNYSYEPLPPLIEWNDDDLQFIKRAERASPHLHALLLRMERLHATQSFESLQC